MKKLSRLFVSLCFAALLAACFAAAAAAQTPVFTDMEAVSAYVRQEMVERAGTVEFVYQVPYSEIGAFEETRLQSFLGGFNGELYESVFRHTGKGKEGDYLHANYNRYSLQLSVSSAGRTHDYALDMTLTVDYKTTAAQEKQVDAEVEKTLARLRLDGKTEYEKLRAIYDEICGRVAYDYDRLHDDAYDLKYTAYAALINGTSVCEGYASLLYRLALDAGVDARMITGVSENELHAWNIARVGGRYYLLDATWDAGNDPYLYFLRGSGSFPNHTAEAKFTSASFAAAYPISSADFKPTSACAHVWSAGTVTRPATCTEAGVLTRICGKCGDALDEAIPASGHQLEEIPPIPATCATQGRIPYFVCTVCGELFADGEAEYPLEPEETFYPALGHDYAAWTPAGETEHRRICRNDPAHVETQAHVWGRGQKAADGSTVYTCSVCGATKTTAPASTEEHGGTVIVIPVTPPTEPTTKKAEEPTTKKAEEPTTKKAEESTTKKADEPTTKKAEEPTTKKAEEPTTRTPGAFLYGDLDENGEIEVSDARFVLRAAVGLEHYLRGGRAFLAADVDGNGEIEVSDARRVLRAAVGLERPEDWKK